MLDKMGVNVSCPSLGTLRSARSGNSVKNKCYKVGASEDFQLSDGWHLIQSSGIDRKILPHCMVRNIIASLGACEHIAERRLSMTSRPHIMLSLATRSQSVVFR
jgi:hypothetical protein